MEPINLEYIRKELSSLTNNYVVLFSISSKNYTEVNLNIVKILVNEQKLSGIYITVGKPYEILADYFKKNGINLDKIYFIDCITKTVQGNPEIKENCFYVNAPKNLTELGLALSEIMKAFEKKEDKFLFLDSLSALSIYNNLGTMAQFSHFLTTKMRLFKIKGIIFSIEREIDEKLFLLLSELCDKVIEV